jgi:SAM-dependent methyltransferase
VNPLLRAGHLIRQIWLGLTARSSAGYWERRYRIGMNSGPGSAGALARFKAEVLNGFVREHAVQSVIEFGCGDGQQLALAEYPRYLGLDVSPAAIELCSRRFSGDPTKSFRLYDGHELPDLGNFPTADLTLSLDVIYHLLEDEVYRRYLADLFAASSRYVIIYSSNCADRTLVRHVRHRRFTDDVAATQPQYRLVRTLINPMREQSFADFYFFERSGA